MASGSTPVEAVFTPFTPVVDPKMFVPRLAGDVARRFENSLAARGRQIAVYGPTGIGKTSLVQCTCDLKNMKYLRVECGEPFETTLQDALAQSGWSKTAETSLTERSEVGGEFAPLGIGKMGSKFGAEREIRATKPDRLLREELIDHLINAKCDVLFFDNFENFSGRPYAGEALRSLNELMKSCSDRASRSHGNWLRIVVAGIPRDVRALIAQDDATARRVDQISLQPMSASEVMDLLSRAGRQLHLNFDSDCTQRIITNSDGYPHYVQLFGLHLARRRYRQIVIKPTARQKSRVEKRRWRRILSILSRLLSRPKPESIEQPRAVSVTAADFDAVLPSVIDDCDGRSKLAYDRLDRKAQLTLQALATGEDLKDPSTWRGGPREDRTMVGVDPFGVLSTLSQGPRALVERCSDGDRYSFADPLMRPYVKLRRDYESTEADRVAAAKTSLYNQMSRAESEPHSLTSRSYGPLIPTTGTITMHPVESTNEPPHPFGVGSMIINPDAPPSFIPMDPTCPSQEPSDVHVSDVPRAEPMYWAKSVPNIGFELADLVVKDQLNSSEAPHDQPSEEGEEKQHGHDDDEE